MSYNDKLSTCIIIVLVILLMITQSNSKNDEYNELVDKYDELEAEYSSYQSDVSFDFFRIEDDMITLYNYFEHEEDYTFDIAKESYDRIQKIVDNYCCD